MPTDDPKQNQQDLKALKLLGARAVVLETQHAGIASEFRALKARAKATRRADTTAESLAASKQGHLERMSRRTPLPESDINELYRDAEAAHPGEISERSRSTIC